MVPLVVPKLPMLEAAEALEAPQAPKRKQDCTAFAGFWCVLLCYLGHLAGFRLWKYEEVGGHVQHLALEVRTALQWKSVDA